jgi:hypothetical protein
MKTLNHQLELQVVVIDNSRRQVGITRNEPELDLPATICLAWNKLTLSYIKDIINLVSVLLSNFIR